MTAFSQSCVFVCICFVVWFCCHFIFLFFPIHRVLSVEPLCLLADTGRRCCGYRRSTPRLSNNRSCRLASWGALFHVNDCKCGLQLQQQHEAFVKQQAESVAKASAAAAQSKALAEKAAQAAEATAKAAKPKAKAVAPQKAR
jgi:hypothetical protein